MEGKVWGSERKGGAKKLGEGVTADDAEGLIHFLDTPSPPYRGKCQLEEEEERETESEEEDEAKQKVVRSRRSVAQKDISCFR